MLKKKPGMAFSKAITNTNVERGRSADGEIHPPCHRFQSHITPVRGIFQRQNPINHMFDHPVKEILNGAEKLEENSECASRSFAREN